MARNGILDNLNRLVSDVWIDRDDASIQIDLMFSSGKITENEAELLLKFHKDGYLIFNSKIEHQFLDQAVSNGRKLWENKPEDLLGACIELNNGRPMPLSYFPKHFNPSVGTRMLDGHSHNPEFEYLSTLPVLHRLIGLILGEKPVATQSLYFTHGSHQPLHRDPWFVVTTPVSTLVACWIALEDISPDAGPLSFVPGSHRLPYKPLSSGDIVFHEAGVTNQSKSEHLNDMYDRMKTQGLQTLEFIARKGEILIWHGSLVHGGATAKCPELTRESLVLHFDAERVHKLHSQAIRIGDEPQRIVKTSEVLERNGSLVFANPVKNTAIFK